MTREEAEELLNEFVEFNRNNKKSGFIDDLAYDFLDAKFNNSAPNQTRIISENEHTQEVKRCISCGSAILFDVGDSTCAECWSKK